MGRGLMLLAVWCCWRLNPDPFERHVQMTCSGGWAGEGGGVGGASKSPCYSWAPSFFGTPSRGGGGESESQRRQSVLPPNPKPRTPNPEPQKNSEPRTRTPNPGPAGGQLLPGGRAGLQARPHVPTTNHHNRHGGGGGNDGGAPLRGRAGGAWGGTFGGGSGRARRAAAGGGWWPSPRHVTPDGQTRSGGGGRGDLAGGTNQWRHHNITLHFISMQMAFPCHVNACHASASWYRLDLGGLGAGAGGFLSFLPRLPRRSFLPATIRHQARCKHVSPDEAATNPPHAPRSCHHLPRTCTPAGVRACLCSRPSSSPTTITPTPAPTPHP